MVKEKRCLKFTGYIYVPDQTDDYKSLRYYASKTTGRIEIFDEGNKPSGKKMEAFDNVGTMLDLIMTEYKKRALKRVPTKKR